MLNDPSSTFSFLDVSDCDDIFNIRQMGIKFVERERER